MQRWCVVSESGERVAMTDRMDIAIDNSEQLNSLGLDLVTTQSRLYAKKLETAENGKRKFRNHPAKNDTPSPDLHRNSPKERRLNF